MERLIGCQGFVHVGHEGFGSLLPRDVVHLDELGFSSIPKIMGPDDFWIFIWQCVKTNSTPSVHIKIAGLTWMFIPLKMVFL